MTLNPFEQLRLLHSVTDPRAAFEDVAAILLRDHGLTDGQVKIHVGDGGIDSYRGSFGRGGELVVYQMKYFPEQWEDSQKQKIRNSFRTASESKLFNLKSWYLCTPSRPTKEDIRWFDTWKGKQLAEAGNQSIKEIDLVDGDDLVKMLGEPLGARARQKLCDWGVYGIRDGYSILEFYVACIARPAITGETFRLVVSVTNNGDRSAEGVRLRIEHADTNSFPIPSDDAFWDDRGNGNANPRTLWAKSDIHPGDKVEVLRLALKQNTQLPFWIKAKASLKDEAPTEQSIVLQAEDLRDGASIPFKVGEMDKTASIGGGFANESLRPPTNQEADDLLMLIAQNPNPSLWGVLVYWRGDQANPANIDYRPSLSHTGMNRSTNRVQFELALRELISLSWLDPAQGSGNVDLYRLTDRAKQDQIFLYNVEQIARESQYA